MTDESGVRNVLSGTVIGNVIQGRDVTLSLPAAVPIAVSGLPPQTVFVGREAGLTRLAEHLDPNTDRATRTPVAILAVSGLAGVGKTALAVRAARDALEAGWFPGGVLMVELRGYEPPERRVEPSAALASLLNALGTPFERIPPDQTDRERLWRSLLADRDVAGQRTLIVLDNASSSQQIWPLLPATSSHRVLVTSRHSLADLEGTRLFDLEVMAADQAVALLKEELATARPDDDRLSVDTAAANRLVQFCSGLPLAVRIIAALLAGDPHQPIIELVESLAIEHHRLEEFNYDGCLSVRAAFDLSYLHLTHAQAQLFRRLALNPGPEISTDAAAALANVGTPTTRRLISQLHRAHLVQPGTSRSRWRMHDLLRLYAAERAAEDQDREAAIDRLLRHYITTSQIARRYLVTPVASRDLGARFKTRQEAVDWLDIEHPNLTSAVTLAYDQGNYAHTAALANALYEFFDLRLHLNDWITTHELALVATHKLEDRQSEGSVLVRLGWAFWRLGWHQKAENSHRLALELCRNLGDRVGEADAILGLGTTFRSINRCNDAAQCHQQALALYRELGDLHGEARALNGLGLRCADRDVGRPDDAERYYRQALQIYRNAGDSDGEANELGNLGNLYIELKRWDEALLSHRQALQVWRDIDDRHGQAGQMNNLGATYREMGQWEEAAAYLTEAVTLYGKCFDHQAQADTLSSLSEVYRRSGQHAEAKECSMRALEVCKPVDRERDDLQTANKVTGANVVENDPKSIWNSFHHWPGACAPFGRG